MLSRRSLLSTGAGAAIAGLFPLKAALAAPVSGLEILGPHNVASILLPRMIDAGDLASAAPGATYRVWRSPDELRAAIISGRTRLFAAPSHVPATLFNRGLPVRVLAVIGLGHLSVVTGDATIERFADLKGKSVLGFFKNDMPDLVFRAVAKMEGLDPDRDMTLTYVQSPMEAAHMLAAGKAETAILSEPPATGSIMMAAKGGRSLRRAVDLQDVWFAHRKQRLPMVVIAADAKLAEECPELIAALRDGLPRAKAWVLANPADAGALAGRTIGVKPEVFTDAISHARLDVISARDAKDELAAFYQTLIDLDARTIGGKLPDDSYYLGL